MAVASGLKQQQPSVRAATEAAAAVAAAAAAEVDQKSAGPVVAAAFLVVQNAGTGAADGVYVPSGRKWLDCDVYQNRYSECIISREAHRSPKTGKDKHGYVLGTGGQPLYGVPTEKLAVPMQGWKAFQGQDPVPEVKSFATLSEACWCGARYFQAEAARAAEGDFWSIAIMMSDRAFDCHTDAKKRARGTVGQGSAMAWGRDMSELLALRADAFLHTGEPRRALLDACAAVHFILPFEWSKARTRGIAACRSLGVGEEQAKLFLEEACRREASHFSSIEALEPWVDSMLAKARGTELKELELKADTLKDPRLYFRVVDPDVCHFFAAPNRDARVLGTREYGDIVRGKQLIRDGLWLELHDCEPYDDFSGDRKAYAPIFTAWDLEEEREEVLERLAVEDFPAKPRWEQLELSVRPLGLKPPSDRETPLDRCRWHDAEREPGQKVWPYVYKHGLALAAICSGAPPEVIDSFVRYHWTTGFNHIFLFFEHEEDLGISAAKALEEFCSGAKDAGMSISVRIMDSQWWDVAKLSSRYFQRRDRSDLYEDTCKALEKHNDRSCRWAIVADLAILEAHEMGMDWFACMNVHDCVHVPKKQDSSMRRFLCSKDRSVESVRLWHLESVPETVHGTDWMRESTLFFVSRHFCDGFAAPRDYDALLRNKEGTEFQPEPVNKETKWWTDIVVQVSARRRAAFDELGLGSPEAPSLQPIGALADDESEAAKPALCTAPTSGATFVRLDRRLKPPLPHSVHSYLDDTGRMLKECCQANEPDDAVILSYPGASLAYWRRRHQAHVEADAGAAVSSQPRPRPRVPQPWSADMMSDIVLRERSEKEQERFYRTFVMQNEHGELPVLAEHGLLRRVRGIQETLHRLSNPTEAEEQLPGRQKLFNEQGIAFGRA